VPPLTGAALAGRIIRELPGEFLPLREQGRMIFLLHDLDKNGYEDVILLGIRRQEGISGDAGQLRDPGRLFFEKKQPVEFLLFVFYQSPGDISLRYTVPLGRKLVFLKLTVRQIRTGRDLPYTVCVSFKTSGGTEEDWVILHGRGISTFSIQETLSIIPVVDDIDGDGYLDVVVHEQGVEEGLGYETFLTWYKWDGRDFREFRSSNIVRNLRNFFQETGDRIMEGDWTGAVENGLFPEVLEGLRNQGLSDREILDRLFRPLAEGGLSLTELQPAGLIFPSFMETPFTYESRQKPEFSFTVGAYTGTGSDSYFEGITEMNRNPFQSHQFGFVPVE